MGGSGPTLKQFSFLNYNFVILIVFFFRVIFICHPLETVQEADVDGSGAFGGGSTGQSFYGALVVEVHTLAERAGGIDLRTPDDIMAGFDAKSFDAGVYMFLEVGKAIRILIITRGLIPDRMHPFSNSVRTQRCLTLLRLLRLL